MDAVVQAQLSEDIIDSGRPDIKKIREEIRQLLNAMRCLGVWLVAMSITYLFMTAVNWMTLDIDGFYKEREDHWHNMYVEDLYTYTKDIEEMKVAHGLSLLAITSFICNMTRKNKVLTKRQYSQLLCLTCTVTVLYLVPLMYIAKITFDEAQENGGRLFADWTFMLLSSSDTNSYGLSLSVFVHMQIYMVIFSMQYLTLIVKGNIRRLEAMRDSGRSSYNSLELDSILGQAIGQAQAQELKI